MRQHFANASARRIAGATVSLASAVCCGQSLASPWTSQTEMAVVRFEIPLQGATRPQIATGFVVSGTGQQHYIVTATHGLFSGAPPTSSSDCKPLPPGIQMFLGRYKGPEVFADCVIHVGSDISLVRLQASQTAYTTLVLNGRDVVEHETLYFAGYPWGEKWADREAVVSIPQASNGRALADANPAPGMSGGPYVERGGTVVGVHHGQDDKTPGWASFVAISSVRASLEKFVPPVTVGPSPVVAMKANVSCSGAAVLNAFRHIPIAVRESVYGQLCKPPDADVVELLKVLPYKPDAVTIASAAAAPAVHSTTAPHSVVSPAAGASSPPGVGSGAHQGSSSSTFGGGGLLGSTAGSIRLPSPNIHIPLPSVPAAASPNPAAQVEAELKVSTRTCLDETRVTIFRGVLNCKNVGQFLPSPNAGGPISPTLIVLHSSGITTARAAIAVYTSPNFSASAHVLIDRDGSFVQLVPFDRAAWHAGGGTWEGMTALNNKSIGIELVNAGRLRKGDDGKYATDSGAIVPASDVEVIRGQPWQRYTPEQIAATIAIGKALAKSYDIKAVVGHCDIQPGRKVDPGPAFPTGTVEGNILNIRDRRASCADHLGR